MTHLDWTTRVGLGPSVAVLDTMICSLPSRWVMGLRDGHWGAENQGGDRPEREVHNHSFPSIWWSDRVPRRTDETPKELQHSFQLRHCLDYGKFKIVGPELMMPHGHSEINRFIFGSSFRMLSKLFSHFEPFFLHLEIQSLSLKILDILSFIYQESLFTWSLWLFPLKVSV